MIIDDKSLIRQWKLIQENLKDPYLLINAKAPEAVIKKLKVLALANNIPMTVTNSVPDNEVCCMIDKCELRRKYYE